MHDPWILTVEFRGGTQDFLKGRSKYLKKGVCDVASEAIGFVLLKHQNHTECKTFDNISLRQVSAYMEWGCVGVLYT